MRIFSLCHLQSCISFLLSKLEQQPVTHLNENGAHNVILHSFNKQGGAIPPGYALDLENKLILQAFKEIAY